MSENQNGEGVIPKNVPTPEELQAALEAERVAREEEQAKRKRAENAAQALDIENKRLRKEREGEGAPITRDDLKGVYREMRQEERLDETIAKLITDPNEQSEVRRIISEEIKPTGNLVTDIEKARAIFGYAKTKKERDEAARALLAKQNAGQGGGDGGARRSDAPTLTETEKNFKKAFPEMSDEQIISMRK